MADDTTPTPEETTEAQQSEQLSGGAYDVLRKRLQSLDQELISRVDQVNAKRKEVFGGTESAIIGNDRVKTEHNCLARDIVSLGKHLLVGYNVFIGLKTETAVNDVFQVFEFDGEALHESESTVITNDTFQRDFSELFRYYKNARFLQFVKTINQLLAVFQIGDNVDDVKVFRWRLKNDQSLEYIDDRGDQEYKFPAQHDFKWTKSTRDDQVFGKYPHVSVLDRLFVETVGGDLTIKIEDNTETGEGIYAEPVENADQTLDDADIAYAAVGDLILLSIQPYMEAKRRYFLYNPKTEKVIRQDSIGQACVQLPEGHGLIFPKGCYLENGDYRQFQEDVDSMVFLQVIRSPNGEDYLYVFYQKQSPSYVLLQYNMIAKKLENPIFCQGYSLYHDGKMMLFTATDEEPKRVHAVQIWQTPFYADTHEIAGASGSHLEKIGNRDLVRAISDCYSVSRLINSQVVNLLIYQDLIDQAAGLLDGYHWLEHAEVFNLKETIANIKRAAVAAVDEYEKVEKVRQSTAKQIAESAKAVESLIKEYKYGSMRSVDDFVDVLNGLRSRRGQVITLRELRFADHPKIQSLEDQLEQTARDCSLACVDFLLREASLKPYFDKVAEIDAKLEDVTKVADVKPLDESLEELSERLDLLTDVVNNLDIDDSTKTTRIVDAITDVYAAVNRSKAMVRNRRQDLGRGEATAEFAAQFKLLSQSINNYIGLCDSPEKCDEFLTKLMIQVEELEGRFADFEDFVEQLSEKREEAYSAFTNRKQVLEEEKKRRINSMLGSANRIMKGIRNRAETFGSVEEVNAYFASDLMVAKMRDLIDGLSDLGDSVKADDLLSQLKTAKDATIRKLRDKIDLYEEGDLIKFGEYKFTVNTQPLELTTVYRDDEMVFHLTGTDFYEPVTDESFLATQHLWEQEIVSETREVYRGEYLAYLILQAAVAKEAGLTMDDLTAKAEAEETAPLFELVRSFAADRYNEGY